jgi:hypothetical protein
VTSLDVLVVSAPACHLCADAESALAELARTGSLTVRSVSASSEDGRRVVAEHRPGMFPVVLVDGALFSIGRLPRGKLRKLLEARGA